MATPQMARLPLPIPTKSYRPQDVQGDRAYVCRILYATAFLEVRPSEISKRGGEKRPGVIFIAGEAGIGKSRLVDESLAQLSRPILRGQAAAESMSPYTPLVQMIRAYGGDHLDAMIGLSLTRHLSLLLPELRVGQEETDPPTLPTAICDVAAAAGDTGSIYPHGLGDSNLRALSPCRCTRWHQYRHL
jgi:hypothetical protein